VIEQCRELQDDEIIREGDLFDAVGSKGYPVKDTIGKTVAEAKKRYGDNFSFYRKTDVPQPGEGYRLLRKGDDPEPTIEGDEIYYPCYKEWRESHNWHVSGGRQTDDFYYRRKIEPSVPSSFPTEFAKQVAEVMQAEAQPAPQFQTDTWYRQRDGRRAYILVRTPQEVLDAYKPTDPPFTLVGFAGNGDPTSWTEDGKFDPENGESGYDLMEEWVDPTDQELAEAVRWLLGKDDQGVLRCSAVRFGTPIDSPQAAVRAYREAVASQ